MTKLTLSETVALSLKNHFPLELVPGTTEKSHRFHCLINSDGLPELSLVFGDEAHGYLFDSAWISAIDGKLRIKEHEVRKLLELSFIPPRWTREMPAAENPVRVPLHVLNSDLGIVRGSGIVVKHTEVGLLVAISAPEAQDPFNYRLETEERPKIGNSVDFEATQSLFGYLTSVSFC